MFPLPNCPIVEHSPEVTHTLTQRKIDRPLSPTEPAAESTHQKTTSAPLPLALGRATSLLTVLIIGEQSRDRFWCLDERDTLHGTLALRATAHVDLERPLQEF